MVAPPVVLGLSLAGSLRGLPALLAVEAGSISLTGLLVGPVKVVGTGCPLGSQCGCLGAVKEVGTCSPLETVDQLAAGAVMHLATGKLFR